MNQQQNAALESMKEWLAHPDELGKEPAKIELAGEFDLHELHYYIFKYKKSILGKWLLGVCGGYEPGETEHCGHVFSEMEPYEETTAKEKAIAMVEMIRLSLIHILYNPVEHDTEAAIRAGIGALRKLIAEDKNK